MSDYTITLKRISELYGENEIISWFTKYEELSFLSYEQYKVISTPDSFGTIPFTKTFLARMIYEHYYLREIAYETPEMFKHYAKIKMKEIMRKISSINLFSLFEI